MAGENLKGFNFDGNGYVILDKARFNPRKSAQITVTFKTMSEDGLLFLMGDPEKNDFLSIQLIGGKIVLKVFAIFLDALSGDRLFNMEI